MVKVPVKQMDFWENNETRCEETKKAASLHRKAAFLLCAPTWARTRDQKIMSLLL